ncbi:MAG: hypothetical protein IPK79_03775 [Vampirovibrionales bacterium]|nr:hypothetical protein [Vampirovibrionales bacterium]
MRIRFSANHVQVSEPSEQDPWFRLTQTMAFAGEKRQPAFSLILKSNHAGPAHDPSPGWKTLIAAILQQCGTLSSITPDAVLQKLSPLLKSAPPMEIEIRRQNQPDAQTLQGPPFATKSI